MKAYRDNSIFEVLKLQLVAICNAFFQSASNLEFPPRGNPQFDDKSCIPCIPNRSLAILGGYKSLPLMTISYLVMYLGTSPVSNL